MHQLGIFLISFIEFIWCLIYITFLMFYPEKDESDFLNPFHTTHSTEEPQRQKGIKGSCLCRALIAVVITLSLFLMSWQNHQSAVPNNIATMLQNSQENVKQTQKNQQNLREKPKKVISEPLVRTESSHLHLLQKLQNLIPIAKEKLSEVLMKDPEKLSFKNLTINQEKVLKILSVIYKIQENFPQSELEQKLFLAFHLALDPYNLDYMEAEYYLLNKKYSLDETIGETPICVVATGRNNDEFFHSLYDSILRQNYTNYRVVLVDDFSDSLFPKLLNDYIRKLPQKYQEKTIFIQNNQRKYALQNRHNAIKKYCKPGELVVDLDLDDWLIGRQVFNFLNHHFQKNTEIWLFYSNLLSLVERKGLLHKPIDFYPENVMKSNTFRDWGYFKTSELRVYKFELYEKIDQQDFIDSQGKFYRWNSDMFMQYPMMQMACPLHCQKLEEFLYYYNYNFDLSRPRYSQKHEKMIVQTQIPYEKLNTLYERPQRKALSNEHYMHKMIQDLRSSLKTTKVDKQSIPNKRSNVCMVMGLEMLQELQKFQDSYIKSNYTSSNKAKFVNYATLLMDFEHNKMRNEKHKHFVHIQKPIDMREFPGTLHYDEIYKIINGNCIGYQYIVFGNTFPKQGALEKIASLMKNNNIWVIFSSGPRGYDMDILAVSKKFLERIYEDQLESKNKQLLSNNYEFLVVALLQLSNGHNLEVEKSAYFEQSTSLISIHSNAHSKNIFYGYQKYDPVNEID